MSSQELAPSGLPLTENMSLAEYYGVYPQDLPSQFEPRDFPPRECLPIQRHRTRTHIRHLIEDF